jgi:tetratricopeptide (TPR) repeat protein
MERAKGLEAEAREALKKALKLAPDEPQVLLSQASMLMQLALAKQAREQSANAGAAQNAAMEVFGSAQNRTNWWLVAQRCPTNPAVVGYWGSIQVIPELLRPGNTLNDLPAERRKNLLEAMRMLEKMGEDPHRYLASSALEKLGILQFMTTHDSEAARAAALKSVEFDPSREKAWDLLAVLAIMKEDWKELVEVNKKRVKTLRNPRGELLLSKAYEKTGELEKALEAAHRATQMDTNSPLAHLCAAAMHIRTSKDEESDEQAKEHLEIASKNAVVASPEDALNCATSYYCNLAVLLGLENRKREARDALNSLKKLAGENEEIKDTVKEIERALGP